MRVKIIVPAPGGLLEEDTHLSSSEGPSPDRRLFVGWMGAELNCRVALQSCGKAPAGIVTLLPLGN